MFSADRAKQIKTKAHVNEDPTEALLRELREQNEKLKAMLKSGKVDDNDVADQADREGLTAEEREKLKKEWLAEAKANMEANDREMEEMKKDYEQKLKEAQQKAQASPADMVNVRKNKNGYKCYI